MPTPSRAPSQATVDLIKKLIAFDTTSRNSNLALIRFVQEYLTGLGIPSQLVFDETEKKANLFATIGPPDRPGVVLSGHTDVVPVDGQDWASDPFQVVEKDGRLYGRGTCDMKSFVATALALAPEFQRLRLTAPVHLSFSYDEEVGCIGVRRLIAELGRLKVKPIACVVGEPTSMKVIRAHKGKTSYRCHVHGAECHSSLAPRGVNAIEYAAEVISHITGLERRFAAEGPFDRDFDVPHTTAHTGVIHGGTALNIVPKDCWFDFEFRYLPGQDPKALVADVRRHAETVLQPKMTTVVPGTGFSWTELSGFPGLSTDEDAEVAQLAKSATGDNAAMGKVSFGTEAGLFDAAGIPTIVCGPGDIEQAHKPNEFVALEQVALCETFLRRIVERFAG
ncbi:MAG TPA: acetylornithine deacetylase [Alphaproteobacteria bacterium]